MENYKEKIGNQLKEVNQLIVKSDRRLAKLKDLPDQRIITCKRGNGSDQYYWIDKASKKRRYAKVSEIATLKKIAQRDYDQKVNAKLKQIKKNLESLSMQDDISEIEMIFKNMAEGRKKLVVPIIETDEQFVKRWKEVEYEPMGFKDGAAEFCSDNGIWVRSKSELMIANALEKAGIPFRYEYPIKLKSIGNVRPDFMCLNVRTRKEIFWEHFGRMDDEGYVNRNVPKIADYAHSGYFQGENMIMTFETSQHPLSSRTIKLMIEHYLY
ncbi:hypothetical protein [Butyrivibrio sp. VCD2006]|uniref:hypothetical protein n=1 Tax=Butyrivibrio sp. VCD2006 TaxID=1280664 RepID=UPI0003FCD819|nr:hypothetical protein [Butyrivibrio sp. VCD2006]